MLNFLLQLEVGNGLSNDQVFLSIHYLSVRLQQTHKHKNTHIQNLAHFSLWALTKAPLILGNDLRNVSEEVLRILKNEEVIAVSQDPLGKQGVRVSHDVYVC